MTALAPVALELLKGKPTKEQADLILEPLQVMINLAVLGFCPIGTKININNNMLYLHQHTVWMVLRVLEHLHIVLFICKVCCNWIEVTLFDSEMNMK